MSLLAAAESAEPHSMRVSSAKTLLPLFFSAQMLLSTDSMPRWTEQTCVLSLALASACTVENGFYCRPMCGALALAAVAVLSTPVQGAWLLHDKDDGPWHLDLKCYHERRTEHGECIQCGDLRFKKCSKCGCPECNHKCGLQSCKACHKCVPFQNSSRHTTDMAHYVTEISCSCGKTIEVKRARVRSFRFCGLGTGSSTELY